MLRPPHAVVSVCGIANMSFSFGARSYSDQLAASVAKTGEVCAVQVDVRTLSTDGEGGGGGGYSTEVVFIAHDFRFMGGSLGCAEGEKSCGFEHAQARGLPVVLLCQSAARACKRARSR